MLSAASVEVHSVSFDAAKLGVKTAFVRLPAPPLPPWATNGVAAAAHGNGAAEDAQQGSLAEAVHAAAAVPDAGGVKAEGESQTGLDSCVLHARALGKLSLQWWAAVDCCVCKHTHVRGRAS